MSPRIFTMVIVINVISPLPVVNAIDPCVDAKTTIEMNQCIFDQVKAAEAELKRYLEESRRRLAGDPKTLAALEESQKAWLAFREAHCGAIYQYWREGTIRGSMEGNCLLDQTWRRTHDLWEAYLAFMDSTQPVLPEPKIDQKRR